MLSGMFVIHDSAKVSKHSIKSVRKKSEVSSSSRDRPLVSLSNKSTISCLAGCRQGSIFMLLQRDSRNSNARFSRADLTVRIRASAPGPSVAWSRNQPLYSVTHHKDRTARNVLNIARSPVDSMWARLSLMESASSFEDE